MLAYDTEAVRIATKIIAKLIMVSYKFPKRHTRAQMMEPCHFEAM